MCVRLRSFRDRSAAFFLLIASIRVALVNLHSPGSNGRAIRSNGSVCVRARASREAKIKLQLTRAPRDGLAACRFFHRLIITAAHRIRFSSLFCARPALPFFRLRAYFFIITTTRKATTRRRRRCSSLSPLLTLGNAEYPNRRRVGGSSAHARRPRTSRRARHSPATKQLMSSRPSLFASLAPVEVNRISMDNPMSDT